MFRRELAALGCDASEVFQHQARIRLAADRQEKPEFKIIDTCRVDNGGLLDQGAADRFAAALGSSATKRSAVGKGVAAFIPAAGAASRYSQPLADLIESLEALGASEAGRAADPTRLAKGLEALAAAGAANWPLPPRVMELLANPQRAFDLSPKARQELLNDLQLPKAQMPCVKEGLTFLAMKRHEHAAIAGLEGEAYVAPLGSGQSFKANLDQLATTAAKVFEQDAALSTIRFLADGTPYRGPDGNLSLVPAGHGALAKLFPEVKAAFPNARTLFIRNIDNVMGLNVAAQTATACFLGFHRDMLAAVDQIRANLAASDLGAAARAALPFLALLQTKARPDVATFLANVSNPDAKTLWRVQLEVFHTRIPAGPGTIAELKTLFARPLNLLGQVPNTGGDVGGTPCFVETALGQTKIVIEVPHASSADKQDFLANPARATHFNPVFAAVEATADARHYQAMNDDFWLLAEKTFRGAPVRYHETVLYELIGNSVLANAVFVEVPRLVFNPHKSLKDAVNRTLADWGVTGH